ncbi:hypothetical protein BGZ80_008374 [Entomortierella chlamydospora]|uniref:F-box domain-containing protein n=1 Tax=Entomortierella chlamydospora TaxID=101097 RepID=A0A9P6MY02_9FUNG|nr:hypothetical protein BGZ79_005412 [Entomortierella chlamydospora]KAG0017354.1 hypothetical protein BGZ80_008374 [Entomortierella chlamydospora]
MPTFIHTSIFDVPEELFSMIIDLLSPHDITKLMATCKILYYKLEPFLWRHVTIGDHLPEKESLLRNRKHIQTLDVGGKAKDIFDILGSHLPPEGPVSTLHPSIAAYIALPATINLRKLLIPGSVFFCSRSVRKDTRTISHIIPVIRNSPNLMQLHIHTDLIKSYRDIILDTISNKLPLLRILSVGGDSVSLKSGLEFLLTCFQHPRLEDLRCDFSFASTGNSKTFGRTLDSALSPLAPKRRKKSLSSTAPSGSIITAIKLPHFNEKMASIVVRVLYIVRDFCPHLERFEIPNLHFDYDAERDCPSEGWFNHLQHITYPNSYYRVPIYGPSPNFVNSLLEGCSKGAGIKTLDLPDLRDGENASKEANLLGTLAKFYSRTLEEINIDHYVSLTSRDIQDILKTSEKLTKFWIPTTTLVGTLSGDWVCLNLKVLSLVFDASTEQGNGQGGKQSQVLAATHVFEQIGRLTKLETLRLGWTGVTCSCFSNVGPEHPSRLHPSVELETLAGLRNLRHFYMFTDCWQHVGQAEVEFMHGHWPCLEKITVQRLGPGYPIERPHWEWLKEQRPQLRLDGVY